MNAFLKDFIKDLIIALAIVVAITIVIKPTIVKESSMEDTLYENNYLLVNKMAYINKDHPTRGDIVIFKSDMPKDNGRGNKLLIKRVIGVEGDTISFKDNQVYRNGKLLTEDYICNEDPSLRSYPNGETFEVGQDEVFCMGDHRSVSLDSRSPQIGTVSEDRVVGKAFVRLFPFNEICRL